MEFWSRRPPGHLRLSARAGRVASGALVVAVLVAGMLWSGALPRAGAHQQTAKDGDDPIILAAGDIGCDSIDSAYSGGTGTAKRCQQYWTAAQLSSNTPTAVLPLGDVQYNCATLPSMNQVYGPTWGQQKAITHPVVGNHEYYTTCAGAAAGASGYFTYFGSAATPLQPTCTAKCKGYYSYDLGTWHIIAINSECTKIGKCMVGSAEETWLRNDLAAHSNTCTLAYWHRPLYSSSGSGGDASMQAIFQDLYNAHVDVVLNGHAHDYERFKPQNANGNAAANGVTEIVVGTGGDSHTSFNGTAANSVVKDNTTYGVLKLTLHAGSYDWQFIPDGHSGSFTDSGSASCV